MLTGDGNTRGKSSLRASRRRILILTIVFAGIGLTLSKPLRAQDGAEKTERRAPQSEITLKTPSDPMALTIDAVDGLEGAAKTVRELYPDLLRDTESKLGFPYGRTLRVQLVRDHEAFSAAVVAAGGGPRPKHVAAVAFGHKDLIILKSRAWTAKHDESLKTIFQHELAHCFIGHLERVRLGVRIPLWLNEGVAQWVSESIFWGKMEVLEQARAKGSVIPLKDLDAHFPEEEGASQLAYAQSLALVRYIANQGDRRGNVAKLLDLLSRPLPMDTALVAVIGVDLAGLERGWLAGQRRVFGLSMSQLLEFSFALFVLVATILLVAVQRGRRRRQREALDAIDRAEDEATALPWREET